MDNTENAVFSTFSFICIFSKQVFSKYIFVRIDIVKIKQRN